MAGVVAQLTTRGLKEALARLGRLEDFQMAQLAAEAAGLLESQTRARFETKQDPSGAPWEAWSEPYRLTRHGGHSLLESSGALRDSIAGYSGTAEARVGSNMVYAAIHQFGGAEVDSGIPARPYLGLSRENEAELEGLVTERLEALLR